MDHSPYYRNCPDSPVAILMIHGILGTPRHFDFLMDCIPESITLHNILLKGHGGSVSDFSKASMEQWKRQVQEAVAELEKPGRKVLIIGHSLGSLLAMEAAATNSSICALLLLNPPLKVRFRLRLVGMSFASAFGTLKPDNALHEAYLSASGIQTEPYVWKYLGWIPNFLALLKQCRRARQLPRQLSVPCHVFLGKEDDLVHLRTAKWLEDLSHVKLTLFPKGIHFGYSNEEQVLIRNALKAFLEAQNTETA